MASVILPVLRQNDPQIGVRLGEIGIDPQGLLVVCDGFPHIAHLLPSHSQGAVRRGVIGLDRLD